MYLCLSSYAFRCASKYGALNSKGQSTLGVPNGCQFGQSPWPECSTKGHAGCSWSQPEVNLLKNTLWLPKLAWRNPNQSVMYIVLGSKVMLELYEVIQMSICLEKPCGYQPLFRRVLDQSVMHCWGQRPLGVIQSQPKFNLLRNTLWLA